MGKTFEESMIEHIEFVIAEGQEHYKLDGTDKPDVRGMVGYVHPGWREDATRYELTPHDLLENMNTIATFPLTANLYVQGYYSPYPDAPMQ